MSPIEIEFLIANRLEEMVSEDSQPGFALRSLTISGLKNQTVQQRVNRLLAARFEAAKDSGPPPYRGIKARMPDGSKLLSKDTNMYVGWSFNNVLSATLNVYASFARPRDEQDIGYYSCMDCINLDLNTGVELTLQDVFTDDTPFLALLSGIVGQRLLESQATEEGYSFESFGTPKLVKPFEGLAGDQCFYLTESALMLVFDYRTPQFETGLQTAVLAVPWTELSGKVALTERFYAPGADLYLSAAAPAQPLLIGYDPEARQRQTSEKVGLVNVRTVTSDFPSFPAAVRAEVEAFSTFDEAAVGQMNAALTAMTPAWIEQYGEGYYELSVSAFSAGRYTNVVRNEFGAFTTPEGGRFWQNARYFCYDRKSNRAVTFRDLFVPGYDPAGVIKQAMRESILDTVLADGPGKELSAAEQAEMLGDDNLARLYGGIAGVCLYSTDMNLVLPSILVGGQQYLVVVPVAYAEFGTANLVFYR